MDKLRSILRKAYEHILKFFLNYFKVKVESLVEDRGGSSSNNDFKCLTPLLLPREEVEGYERQLLSALEGKAGENVFNIAVTGGYAVGKSSFLRTFKFYNPKYESVPVISMANFDKVEETTTDKIEKSIVEQVLYSKSSGNMPFSKYKKIKEPSKLKSVLYPIILIAYIVSCLIYGGYDFKYLAENLPDLHSYLSGFYSWIPMVIIFVVSAFIFSQFFYIISGLTLSKISAKGAEFDNQIQRSFLQENIDELLYYFKKKKSKVNVLIFEDIDRLKPKQAITILMHVREINHVINSALEERVCFIYAVKDELFNHDERVKFFDVIIPIIPVINSNNAFEKMKVALGLDWDTEKGARGLSKSVVRDCSWFFNDMRLVYSFSNEYKLYESLLLNGNNLSKDRLFSFLVIKTLHPKIFSDLLNRKGLLFECLNSRDKVKRIFVESLEKEKLEVLKERKERNNIFLRQCEDLLSLFWFASARHSNSIAIGIYDEGNTYFSFASQIEVGSIFEKALLSNEPCYFRFHSQSQVSLNVHNVKNHMGMTYSQCISLISYDEDYFDKKIEAINGRLKGIEVKKLEDFIKIPEARELILAIVDGGGSNADEAEDLDDIRLLLSKNYIGEDFYEYLGFFYEGSLTQDDKNKVLKIKSGEQLDVNVAFDKEIEVIRELYSNDLSEGRGFIANIFPEILKDRLKLEASLEGCENHLDRLISVWKSLDAKDRAILLKSVNHYHSLSIMTLMSYLIDSSDYAEDDLLNFIFDILSSFSFDDVNSWLDNDVFFNSVSSLESIAKLPTGKYRWFWESESINYYQLKVFTKKQAELIIENEQFIFSLDMLRRLLNAIDDLGDDIPMSYGQVLSSSSVGVKSVVNSRINQFIIMLSEQENAWIESHDNALKLLNVEGLSKECALLAAKATDEKFYSDAIPFIFVEDFLNESLIVSSWYSLQRLLLSMNANSHLLKSFASYVEANLDELLKSDSSSLESNLDFCAYMYLLSLDLLSFEKIITVIRPTIELLSSIETRGNLSERTWVVISNCDAVEISAEFLELLERHSLSASICYVINNWPETKPIFVKSDTYREKFIEFISSPDIGIEDKFEFYESICSIDYSTKKELASELVRQALKSCLKMPEINSSLVFNAIDGLNDSERLNLLNYYLQHSSLDFEDICDLFDMLDLHLLRELRHVPRKIRVDQTPEYSAVLVSLQHLGFIGKVKDDGDYYEAYVNISKC
ncbi:hypothetical protein L1D32_09030 [Shewanella insulae]|uniref:YobI family P-loop NTPase n=1 Tax=Shewanella insulae TaxID=2681496 RepID=UPI001EFE2044|nr:hypothetical protein [Shewanella insulae]MCG9738296.1 hypothetical protein [Shewanella insulae]